MWWWASYMLGEAENGGMSETGERGEAEKNLFFSWGADWISPRILTLGC